MTDAFEGSINHYTKSLEELMRQIRQATKVIMKFEQKFTDGKWMALQSLMTAILKEIGFEI